jgi:hypothetical protein
MKATIACLTALLTVVSISLTPVCAKGKKSHGGQTIKRNPDGTVEVTDSGPSGVLPAYGGGGGAGDDGGYTSVEPDGSHVKRNPDGTAEVWDTGPSGVLPGHTSPFPTSKKPSTGGAHTGKRKSTVRKTAAKASSAAKATVKKAVSSGGPASAAVRRKLLNRLKV